MAVRTVHKKVAQTAVWSAGGTAVHWDVTRVVLLALKTAANWGGNSAERTVVLLERTTAARLASTKADLWDGLTAASLESMKAGKWVALTAELMAR